MNERENLSTADIASAGQMDREERSEQEEMQMREGSTATAMQQDQSKPAPLFGPDEAQPLRTHWDQVQASFVDDPRQTVQQADSLVAEVIKRLADSFAEERSKLEEQWSRGENVSTEDLRIALQHYRSFFDRLLSI